MATSSTIREFVRAQESSPAVQASPREAIEASVQRAEAVAYSKGLVEGLSRLEKLAAIVPGRISGADVIRMIGNERDAAIMEWEKRYTPLMEIQSNRGDGR